MDFSSSLVNRISYLVEKETTTKFVTKFPPLDKGRMKVGLWAEILHQT